MRKYPGPLIRADARDPDLTYKTLRDNPKRSADREFAEARWSKYWPYADVEFYEGIARDFHPRFWEMDLACGLLGLGLRLEGRQRKGPDIAVILTEQRLWLEAVAPTDGVGPNMSPDLTYEEPAGPDHKFTAHTFTGEDGVILRFRHAIEEKTKKYREYRDAGIVGPGDAYVIAANGCRVSASILETDLPWVVKAVYPFGAAKIRIDLETEAVKVEHEYRRAIQNAAQSAVATDIFLDPEYAGISGVLFSRDNVWNRRDDYVYVHNLMSTNRLARGWLPVGTEYWPEEESLHVTRHSGDPSA